jgi:hypothetical protein
VQFLADLAEGEVGRQELEHPHLRPGQRHRARDRDVPAFVGKAGQDPAQLLPQCSFGQQSGQMSPGVLRPEVRSGAIAQLEEDLGGTSGGG